MTAITINIPNHEVSFFKKMISKMGWTYTVAGEETTAKKSRLYDPEGKLKSYETVDAMFQDLGINV